MKQTVCAVLSIAVTLLLGEGLVRAASQAVLFYDVEMAKYATQLKIESPDPLRTHQHKPNGRAMLMGVEVRTNALGFRDDEVAFPKPSGLYRIEMLGDSITMGWGVAQADSFSEVLQRTLNEKRGRITYDVVNMGVGNYNTVQEVESFFDDGRRLQPDLVVLNYFINDAEPTPVRSKSFAMNYSLFSVFLWSKLRTIASRFAPRQSYLDYYRGLYQPGAPGWEAAKQAMQRLFAGCRARNIPVVVTCIPELHQLRGAYPFADIHASLRRFVEDHKVEFVDLYPAFAGHDEPSLWVSAEDAHPNAKGHRLIADALYQAFMEKGILK